MNKIQQVESAFKMGWGVKLGDDCVLVSIAPLWTFLNKGIATVLPKEHVADNLKITGFLYLGELAGNELIPEGQRFRVKETGEILKYEGMENEIVKLYQKDLKAGAGGVTWHDKSEIEPHFSS